MITYSSEKVANTQIASTKKKIRPILIQLFALGSFGSATPPKKKAMVATTEATKETKLKICPACPSHKCSPI